MLVKNKKYFVDVVNSSKANKFMSAYHYSGTGFKQAKINLGVYNNSDSKMVGCLQWGCNFQDKIRLDRYVKDPIKKEEYLELNRFSMADSEGKNSESQAIGLGIKWIKKNCPSVRLLVSYAGRKEGNYGYIYQATNWEYLGYFISKGFWQVDGDEYHLMSLWKKTENSPKQMVEALKDIYTDIRETHTKQFIYIQRLDKNLIPASEILPYPKPDNEYPIKTREIVHAENLEVLKKKKSHEKKPPVYYYKPGELLFSKKVLIKRGELEPYIHKEKIEKGPWTKAVARYSIGGDLECIYNKIIEGKEDGYLSAGIIKSAKNEKSYKDKYFRYVENIDNVPEEIEVDYVCIIDEIPFRSWELAGKYLGVSRQAVHQASKRKSKQIAGKDIVWI